MDRIGYACINMTLGSIKPASKKITVNRGMVKKTFQERGLQYAGELALQNIVDLEKVLLWNVDNNILFYRMSSDMFPWGTEYKLSDLPQYALIQKQLKNIGALAKMHNMRLTFHPGPFNVLATPNRDVLLKTVHELNFHASIMDAMELPQSVFAKINIHVGGAYGDKKAAMSRFCDGFQMLNDATKQRLTVENDDRKSMYTVQDLYDGIHSVIDIPIVFDSLHYACHPGEQTQKEAFLMAYETWPKDIVPVIHVSEPRSEKKDGSIDRAHADYIETCFDSFGRKVDIMLEAKAKELAALRYIKNCMKI